MTTAFDRAELISDALTAIVACRAALPVVTADREFDVLARIKPGLRILVYKSGEL